MKKSAENRRIHSSMFSWRVNLFIFLGVAFAVTASVLLLMRTMGLTRDMLENVDKAALLTFGNVVVISFIITTTYYLFRKQSLEIPLTKLLDATDRISKGDFHVRVEDDDSLFTSGNEIGVLISDFNNMAAELEGMDSMRSDFMSNVSHEMKTPLAVMQNYADALQHPGITEEQRIEYAAVISQQSKNLSDMISNILRINKLENQILQPKTTVYNLGEQLRETILLFEALLEEKELELEIEIEDLYVNQDPELLSLIWNNLLSNAMKFTLDRGTIGIRLSEQDGMAMVQIRDTGCGMDEETGKHIFDKFYQGDTSHATKGNGLGLALVKRIVELLQLDIQVESTLGEGSAFTVVLPLVGGEKA